MRLVPRAAEISDTPAARRALAERYLVAVENSVPVLESIGHTWAALGVPGGTRDILLAALHREIRWAEIYERQVSALVAHVTVAELEALVAFVSTPAGASALRNAQRGAAELAPALAAELQRALTKALEETAKPRSASSPSAASDVDDGSSP